MSDRSKHDLDVKYELRLLSFTHRVSHGLCVYCGLVVAPSGQCPPCKEVQRLKRIEKYGADYMEDEGTC